MTQAERALNKQDLEAFKNYDGHQYAMIPGLYNNSRGGAHPQL